MTSPAANRPAARRAIAAAIAVGVVAVVCLWSAIPASIVGALTVAIVIVDMIATPRRHRVPPGPVDRKPRTLTVDLCRPPR